MPQRNGNSRNRVRGRRRRNPNPSSTVQSALSNMGLPTPRLPRSLGSNRNLSSSNSVYPRKVNLDFPILPQFLTIATGALANSLPININLIEQVVGLQGLFAEYCIVGARFEFRCNASATPQGLYFAYVDEESSTTPTAAAATSAPHIEGTVSNTESPSSHMVLWKVANFIELSWTSMSVSTDIPIWLKTFASVSGTGTSASTGAQIMITGAIALCLRGYIGQD